MCNQQQTAFLKSLFFATTEIKQKLNDAFIKNKKYIKFFFEVEGAIEQLR